MYGSMTIPGGMTANQKPNITQTINAYSKRLLGFIRKRVKNEADAEDILQDVFYQFIGNTQPIDQVTSWLFTVARNKIIDRKRKHKPDLLEDIYPERQDELSFDWTDIFTEEKENPETDYLRNLFWEELNVALSELPEEQRSVFVMNELDGIPFKEIAEKTGVAVNTLLSRKRYAVLHLRNRLQVMREELLKL
ncbi:MAG: RNA polymerase sigma factor [Chitinophagaceae bacterium]|nr:MAG: RNA polymerase sigma factor [Chitinophagaceae bacterium]